jgi:hypothetical protein
MTACQSLAAAIPALPDFHRFPPPSPRFFLTISLLNLTDNVPY